MPRRSEAALERKREYDRKRVRRLRGTSYGGERDSKGKGVVPRQKCRPLLEKENVVPRPIPMNPQTMSKAKLVDYLAHVGQRGFSLVKTFRGYELVANTGQLVPFDGVAIIERELANHSQEIFSLKQSNVMLQADLARLEVMMVYPTEPRRSRDSMLREGDLR